MGTVLVTGMSGTGKSTVLVELARRGHAVVDTDTDEWSRWTVDRDGSPDWVWREPTMRALLEDHREGHLFVGGCRTNQGDFYDMFDAIVLLSAPTSVILERLASRDTNDYGKSPSERELILEHIKAVEPLLRRGATHEIDTTATVEQVADRVEGIALESGT